MMNIKKWRMIESKEDIIVNLYMSKEDFLECLVEGYKEIKESDFCMISLQLEKDGDKRN